MARAVLATMVERPVAVDIAPRRRNTLGHVDVQASTSTGNDNDDLVDYNMSDAVSDHDSGIDSDTAAARRNDRARSRRDARRAARHTPLTRIMRPTRQRPRDRNDTSPRGRRASSRQGRHNGVSNITSGLGRIDITGGRGTASGIGATSGTTSGTTSVSHTRGRSREPRSPWPETPYHTRHFDPLATRAIVVDKLREMDAALFYALTDRCGNNRHLRSFMRSEQFEPWLVRTLALPPHGTGDNNTHPATVSGAPNDAEVRPQQMQDENYTLSAETASRGGHPPSPQQPAAEDTE